MGSIVGILFCQENFSESHRLLVDVCGDDSLSRTQCFEWFKRFESGDFDIKDKGRPGQEKKSEDEKLETLLSEDSCQTQDELAKALGVTQATVSRRLKALGFIQRVGNWVSHELKPRDAERRFCMSEMHLERYKRKSFLHRIITGDEKWIHYDDPKRKKSYVLLKSGQTITGQLYRQQLIRLKRALTEKRPEYATRHESVILHHDNARPHVAIPVKNYLESSGWEVLPHPPYSPDLAPSYYHLFRSMQNGLT